MCNRLYFLLAWQFTLIRSTQSLPHDFCQKAAPKVKLNCGNIYIWNNHQEDFISLWNVTTRKPEQSNLSALAGKTVKVIADNMAPYIISSETTGEFSGYLGDIWKIVEEVLKFKSNITSVNYDTGLSVMSEGKADVMLAAGIEKQGLIGIEYSQPYLYNWYHLYIKTPELRPSSSSYVQTLHKKLWIASSGIFSLLAISLWLTIKFLHSNFHLESNVSLPSCLLSVCSGFLNQGFDLKLKSYSGRILTFFAFILGYVLYSAVSAVLVAKLAIFTLELPFTSIADVKSHGKLSLCLRSNSFVYNNFTYPVLDNLQSSDRLVIPEWKKILNGPGCKDINNQTNLAEIICNNGIVVLENRVVMATVVQNFRINCEISYLDERYFGKGNYYFFKKGFQGIEVIEIIIKHMKSVGVLQRLENKWVTRQIKNNGDTSQYTQTPQVTFNHISGVLFFYITMIWMSLVVLCVEVFVYKYYVYDKEREKYHTRPFVQ